MAKTIGYIRVSSVSQKDNSSLANQSQKIKDYCSLNDIPLADILSEIDSGGNDARAVLKMVENLIVENKVSTLIVLKVDRLSRNILGGLQFIDKCKTHNCRVVSITENIDTDNENSNLILSLMLMIATEERRMIKSRCNQGRLMKWKQKKLPYSKIPFGYCKNTDGEIVLDEDNSKVVQYIFRKMNSLLKNSKLTKSKRTRRLLKLLQNRNFTYGGKPFTRWNIRDILNNTFYFGELKYSTIKTTHNYPTIISKRLFNQI